MLSGLTCRVTRRCSVLMAIRKYKGSVIQKRMHSFERNPEQLAEIKKTIDYETVNKQSEGCMMVREFLFQEDKPEFQINFRQKYLIPSGKWSVAEIQKLLETESVGEQTSAEQENELIMIELQEELKQRFKQYYEKMGKKNYTLLVREQVGKIEKMNKEEFERFIGKLEGSRE